MAPKTQGNRGNIPRSNSNGVVIGKSLPKQIVQKPREEKTAEANSMMPGAHFTFGSVCGVENNVHVNKNKRSRVEETNRQGTRVSQSMDQVTNQHRHRGTHI